MSSLARDFILYVNIVMHGSSSINKDGDERTASINALSTLQPVSK